VFARLCVLKCARSLANGANKATFPMGPNCRKRPRAVGEASCFGLTLRRVSTENAEPAQAPCRPKNTNNIDLWAGLVRKCSHLVGKLLCAEVALTLLWFPHQRRKQWRVRLLCRLNCDWQRRLDHLCKCPRRFDESPSAEHTRFLQVYLGKSPCGIGQTLRRVSSWSVEFVQAPCRPNHVNYNDNDFPLGWRRKCPRLKKGLCFELI